MTVSLVMPTWFSRLAAALFGLIIGSFLNVVIARLPRRESLVRPASRCPSCGAGIRWYDNVPLLGYALLRGKCRACRAPISARYPVVEALTGLLFVAAQVRFGWSIELIVRDWPMLAILVAVTFIDLEHRIIPDRLSLGGLVLGLVTCWLGDRPGPLGAIAGAAVGFMLFYALAWAYLRFAGRSGLGGGDIKLLAMLGAFVGVPGVFATIAISSLFGSLVGIVWALASRRGDVRKFAIPYGPFLVIGGLYYYLLGDWLWFRFTTAI